MINVFFLILFGFCQVVFWADALPDKPMNADIVITTEISRKISKTDAIKIERELKYLLSYLSNRTKPGQVRVMANWFGENVKPAENSSFTNPSNLVKHLSKRKGNIRARPNMTKAFDEARKQLEKYGRKGAKAIIVYLGSGENSASFHSLMKVMEPKTVKMFGIIASKDFKDGENISPNLEERLVRFDNYSRVGSLDTYQKIKNLLSPQQLSPVCPRNKADIMILMENSYEIHDSIEIKRMETDIKKLLKKLHKKMDKGQVRVILGNFAENNINFSGPLHESILMTPKQLLKYRKHTRYTFHREDAAPNMTRGILHAKEALRDYGRKGTVWIVVYVGSGKNSASLNSLNEVMTQRGEIFVLGEIAANMERYNVFSEKVVNENIQHFDDFAGLKSASYLYLKIRQILVPYCRKHYKESESEA